MKRFIPNLLMVAVSFASLEAMAATDLVLFNGKIFTADRNQPKVQALAVQDGKVLQVGSDAQIKALIESGTQVIDLGGKTLMPGLIDSHSHAIFGGLEMVSANMEDEVVELDELEKRLRAWREDGKAKHGDVLSVAGMSSAYWAQAFFQFVEVDHFVFHVGRDHLQSAENRVGMAVDQAGHQRLAVQVDDLCSRLDQRLDLRIAADLQHFAVLNGQRLNLGLVAVGGENLAVE